MGRRSEAKAISIRDLRRDRAFEAGGELVWAAFRFPGLRTMLIDRWGPISSSSTAASEFDSGSPSAGPLATEERMAAF